MTLKGVIIKESLENEDVLKDVKILNTRVEQVTEKHKTPWITQWTLYTIEIADHKADIIAEKVSRALDSSHAWYADYENDKFHYIIFKGKVFKIVKTSKEQYDEAKKYGVSLGIPEYQVDFHPKVQKWQR